MVSSTLLPHAPPLLRVCHSRESEGEDLSLSVGDRRRESLSVQEWKARTVLLIMSPSWVCTDGVDGLAKDLNRKEPRLEIISSQEIDA